MIDQPIAVSSNTYKLPPFSYATVTISYKFLLRDNEFPITFWQKVNVLGMIVVTKQFLREELC